MNSASCRMNRRQRRRGRCAGHEPHEPDEDEQDARDGSAGEHGRARRDGERNDDRAAKCASAAWTSTAAKADAFGATKDNTSIVTDEGSEQADQTRTSDSSPRRVFERAGQSGSCSLRRCDICRLTTARQRQVRALVEDAKQAKEFRGPSRRGSVHVADLLCALRRKAARVELRASCGCDRQVAVKRQGRVAVGIPTTRRIGKRSGPRARALQGL